MSDTRSLLRLGFLRDLERAENYLRYHATAKEWPRLAEIADLLAKVQDAADEALRESWGQI